MPDATGLELLAGDVRDGVGEDAVLGTEFFREQATILVEADRVLDVLELMRGKGYRFLASVHGVDYYPEEPRLGVHYELLSHELLDRIRLKVRVALDVAEVPSATPAWPTANHHEREVFDMFGVVFTGHPDLRRILLPEDYEGHPQRRDFPIGGEPVLFTKDHDRDYTRGVDVPKEVWGS